MFELYGYIKSPISQTLFYKRYQGCLLFVGFNGNSVIRIRYSPTVPSYIEYFSYGRYDILTETRISKPEEELNNFIAWSSVNSESVTPDCSDPTAYILTDPTKFVAGTVILQDTDKITDSLVKSVLGNEIKMIKKHAKFLNYEK